MLLQAVAGTLR